MALDSDKLSSYVQGLTLNENCAYHGVGRSWSETRSGGEKEESLSPPGMPPAGLEPATPGLADRYSVQLSYGGTEPRRDITPPGSFCFNGKTLRREKSRRLQMFPAWRPVGTVGSRTGWRITAASSSEEGRAGCRTREAETESGSGSGWLTEEEARELDEMGWDEAWEQLERGLKALQKRRSRAEREGLRSDRPSNEGWEGRQVVTPGLPHHMAWRATDEDVSRHRLAGHLGVDNYRK